MAFQYDEFYANLALSSVKKQHYIRTMETLYPDLQGWSEQFQQTINRHPQVKNFIDEATYIARDKVETKHLLTDIRNHYQKKRKNIHSRDHNDHDGIKRKVSLAALVFALNNRDTTESLERYGVTEQNSEPIVDHASSSVNNQGLFSPEQQPSYQVIFNM